MRVSSVLGVHGSKATGGVPYVSVVVAQPRSHSAQSHALELGKVVHLPEARAVIIYLKVIARSGDGFVNPRPGPLELGRSSELRSNISLKALKGRNLRGYRVVIRDEHDNDLAEGAWP